MLCGKDVVSALDQARFSDDAWGCWPAIPSAGGLVDQVAQRGEPSIFIAHGTRGEVLPIDVSSGRRVARLERDGYEVRYRKFDGGHAVPRDRARGSGLVRRLARLRG